MASNDDGWGSRSRHWGEGDDYDDDGLDAVPLLRTEDAPEPPPEALPRHSFDSLASDARDGRLVFRVYTPNSASPLVWTGDARTSGFGALNGYLGSLTPETYAGALAGDSAAPWTGWTTGPLLRQTIVDHTNKKCRASWDVPWEGDEVGPDGLSPWVSASADAGWAVWEVARRLVMEGEKAVNVAVIAIKPGRRGDTLTGASGELALNPIPPLRDMARHGRGTAANQRMTNSEKEGVAVATYAASSSAEILFFGRVFATSIVADLEFTRDSCPLDLPASWQTNAADTTSWLDRLVWDPAALEADWHAAKRLIGAKGGRPRASASNNSRNDTQTAPTHNLRDASTGDSRVGKTTTSTGATNATAAAPAPKDTGSEQSRRIAAGQRDSGWATFHARGGTVPPRTPLLPPPRRQRAATAQR